MDMPRVITVLGEAASLIVQTGRLPGLDREPVAEATCLYTTTPTDDFVLDRIGPVVIASPCSGHGAEFAPLIGAMAADLAQGYCGGLTHASR